MSSSCVAVVLVAVALALGALVVGLFGPPGDKRSNAASSVALAAGALAVVAVAATAALWRPDTAPLPLVGDVEFEIQQ